MKNLSRWALLVVLGLDWWTTSTVRADGCYFPKVAIKRFPEIPSQSALLRWKDGVETLVISSTLNSEAQELGWLIPLPAAPTVMEKADPGGLKTLSICIQPRITHDLYLPLKDATITVIVAVLLVWTFLFRREDFLGVALLIVLGFVLSGMLLSALSSGGADSGRRVHVENTAQVGAYQVAVLTAKRADDLNDWLGQNGFAALPAAANSTVTDYIHQHWVFVAIKLTRDKAGLNAPHPIRLSFPAAQAVYPLKLTALAGGAPTFELFVIAEREAVSDMLDREFAGQFNWVPPHPPEHARSDPGAFFTSPATGVAIGHPTVIPLLWDGCVLTKLSGKIPAVSLTRDLTLQWRSVRPYRQRLFSQPGAFALSLILFEILLGIGTIVALIAYRRQSRSKPVTIFALTLRLLQIAGGAAVVAGLTYFLLPRISSQEIRITRARWEKWHVYDQKSTIEDALTNRPAILYGRSDEITAAILKLLTPTETPIAGEPGLIRVTRAMGSRPLVESTPGNFTIEKTATQVIINVYDEIGRPRSLEYAVTDTSTNK